MQRIMLIGTAFEAPRVLELPGGPLVCLLVWVLSSEGEKIQYKVLGPGGKFQDPLSQIKAGTVVSVHGEVVAAINWRRLDEPGEGTSVYIGVEPEEVRLARKH